MTEQEGKSLESVADAEKSETLELRRVAVCVFSGGESGSPMECLEAIGSQIVSPEVRPTIIVVDSETGTDRRRDIEGFKGRCPYDVVYFFEAKASAASAKNKAIEAALARSVEWVVFLEDNSEIEPDWLINIVYPNYHRVSVTPDESLDAYEDEPLCYFLGTKQDSRNAIYVRFSADILRKGLRFTDDKGRTWAEISSVLQWVNRASPSPLLDRSASEPTQLASTCGASL